jgi:hypothetical protein
MPPVFFTDRNLGKQFPTILRDAGLNVERHADHFEHDCPDEIWLEEIGKRGWIAITHDGRIRYKPNELAAVVKHRVGLLVVIGNAPFPQLAHSFAATKTSILNFVTQHEPPYIAKVYRHSAAGAVGDMVLPGRVEVWYSGKG